jgi:ATP-dependent Clp endopeptidase proteolytic subunit ClpP
MNIETTWYNLKAKAKDGPVEMSIYDEIGLWGVTAKDFIFDLGRAKGRDINLTLHTPGGDVADGLAIYNALKKHDGHVSITVDTVAASMGSVIALAGDETSIVDNGFIMVHNPWSMAVGNAADMEKASEDLKKFEKVLVNTYIDATGKDEDEIRTLMDAETWMTAEEAVENGFAGSIVTATKAAASMSNFRGACARNLESNRPLPVGIEPSTITETKDKKMEKETIIESEELQAKIEELTAALESKETELAEANALATKSVEQNDEKVASVRADAAKIVEYGKAHDKVDMAVSAIAEGKSIEAFKSELLDAYAEGIEVAEPVEEVIKVDANKDPESRAEFIKTYDSLKGRERGAYWDKYSKTFLV